jgi:D-beta-D-heptose 7-phosphate kinase/D-beta-D-heptose 1-phosphate adenosyltransferase|tara:strand:+ start:1733 stop:2509 length:777 start_codon:yes stop_codon:yes gene_type:complete
MSKVVLVTGGFDPLHSGHIAYFKAAKELGDHLIVGVNSNEWLTRKKGRPFMPFEERCAIIKELACVDEVIGFNDSDDTAINAIGQVLATKGSSWRVVFANGGDRRMTTTPEYATYKDSKDVAFAFGIGGADKANSSSWILEEWKAPKTKRTWGYYRVIHEYNKHTKVKELAVPPGGKLSMQRHQERSEHWFVAEGTATVYTLDSSSDVDLHGVFEQHKSLHIPVGQWHQLANEHDTDLKLVEIQYGTNCVEEDIERTP